MTTSKARMRRTPWPLARDPWVAACMVVLLGALGWTLVPLATGATGPVSSDTTVDLEVLPTVAPTPPWISGDSVELATLTEPGDVQNAMSTGWRITTNWHLGFEIRVRSTTVPALRGDSAIDGAGANSTFMDYRLSGCPCPWSVTGPEYSRGVFGYSVAVQRRSGAAHSGSEKWGTAQARKWRGFSRDAYPAYTTGMGAGQYEMTMYLRTGIPDEAIQREGSYRAGIIVSAHANM